MSAPTAERRWATTAFFTGIAALGISWPLAQRGLSVAEANLFLEINGWPKWVAIGLWPLMQAGTIWMSLVTPAIVAVRDHRGHRQHTRPGLPIAVLSGLTVFVAWYAATVAKAAVKRGRPSTFQMGQDVFNEAANGFGYVSGHTAVAFAAAVVLGRGLNTPGRLGLLGLASLVGLSRIVVGSHLPLDVMGGAGIGLVCGAVGLAIMSRYMSS